MAYKISGTTTENTRIIVIRQDTWEIETQAVDVMGSFLIESLMEGDKVVVARTAIGNSYSYGGVSAIHYPEASDSLAVFGGGYTTAAVNTIGYVSMYSLGNPYSFGELTQARSILVACSNGVNARGIFSCGITGTTNSTGQNTMDYITITSLGNASDFGDNRERRNEASSTSNGTNERGVVSGGVDTSGSGKKVIDYVTISSIGNAINFGEMASTRFGQAATSNGTNERGVFISNYTDANVIDYITISNTGNSLDFGDMTVARYDPMACSNFTDERGVFIGGASGTYSNIMDYITISSLGNASDFGDLVQARSVGAACSNTAQRGIIFAGYYLGNPINNIEYITINSLGNALDFGDLAANTSDLAATANA